MAVVIVNWNQPAITIECLRALRAQTFSDWFAIVVDNGSTDESPRILRESGLCNHILESDRNVGFAAGCNLGIRRGLGESATHILLLNNDAFLQPECLGRLMSPDVDGVQLRAPVILSWSRAGEHLTGTPRVWSAGARLGLVCARELSEKDMRLPWTPVDYITGCAMLMDKRLISDVGLLDERFFMYYEDLEYCDRAIARGHRIGVVPDAHVLHAVATSTTGNPRLRLYYRARSGMLYHRLSTRSWRRSSWAAWAAGRVAEAGKVAASLHSVSPLWWLARGLFDGMRLSALAGTEHLASDS